jgi:hypothetical protein
MRRFFGVGIAVLTVGGLVGACGSSGNANLKGRDSGLNRDGGGSCVSNTDCGGGLCLLGVCVSGKLSGGSCTSGTDCASGVCQGGACVGNGQGVPSGGPCTTNDQCASGKCTTAKCATGSGLSDGKSCASATECASGACTNGICGKGSSSGGATGAGGASGAGGTSAGMGTGGTVTSVTPIPVANACVTTKSQATGDHLDIFIMEDRSGSMGDNTAGGGTKWAVITGALSGFVNDPKSAGIGAGIGFFGKDTGGGGGKGGGGTSCNAADYATPTVPIAALNGNAAAIVGAIGALTPNGNTPTEPALQGAINYATTWAKANPTHKVIVVFATDGAPNGCNSTPAGADTIAAAGFSGTPAIQTYVIGVIGQGTGDGNCPNGPVPACSFVQTLNGIAKSGGTGSAFIVDTTANSQAQFQAAMNAIRTANKATCDYTIPAVPAGKVLQPRDATVQYTSGTKAPVGVTWVATAAACSPTTGGWYYNSVTSPAQVHLCPSTCTTVQADPLAHIDVLLACVPPGVPGGGGGTTGAGGTGPGGTAGAAGAGGAAPCLLTGQSCQAAADCCGGSCTGGICVLVR